MELSLLALNPLQFQPIHLLYTWKDPLSKDDRVSVAILLPTGVSEKPGDLQIALENETVLKITVMWPSATTSVPQLMQKWLSCDIGTAMKEYYPQVQGFFDLLENFQAREGDSVYSTTQIPLLFIVKTDFEPVLLGWEGTNQIVLFVTLSVFDRNCKMENNLLVQMSRALQNLKAVDVQNVCTISNK